MFGLPNIEQYFYSFTTGSVHVQDLEKELRDLRGFLSAHGVVARTAVDVGCGDGHVTARLRDLLQLDTIHGFEINPRLVEKARRRGLPIVLADVLSMTVTGNFDVAITYGAMHHFRDADPFIAALRRLSRRYVLVVDSTVRTTLLHRFTGAPWFPLEASPYRIRTVDEIVAAMEASGLRILGSHTNENANIWHDRSFILGERSDADTSQRHEPARYSGSV
ncbi:MAG: class I SAM-dependent methyltransferase [Myxococcales bacterium]|nr:class I SAM-dependent methyltransferase [Myxococcales bacterium]